MSCHLIRDLNEYGVCVMDNFLGDERGLNVLCEVKSMYAAGLFKVGSSNLENNFFNDSRIRKKVYLFNFFFD
jgi:hypothetical protein